MIICFVLSSILTLLLAIAENFDNRRPLSTKLRYKYRVKDNSILRRIIKFGDRKYTPANYFKVVPIYICSIVAIFGVALLLIDLITKGVVSRAIPDNVFLILSIVTLVIYILYFLIVLIWWEIVDYREFKFTKDEKEKINP